jgi:hypothetical protein
MNRQDSKPFLKRGEGILASSYNKKKDFSHTRKEKFQRNQTQNEIYHHQYNENQNKYIEQIKNK